MIAITRLRYALTGKNIGSGWMYFYIHFAMEVLCYFCIKQQTGPGSFLWLFPLAYDVLAFVPQALVGYINDRFPRFNAALTGTIMMCLAAASFWLGILPGRYPALVLLCAGNALTHVGGAQVTIRSSRGRLSHSAIFVAGGAFGVITGTMLAKTALPYPVVILFMLTAIPFIIIAEKYKEPDKSAAQLCSGFDYARQDVPAAAVIALSCMVVMLRSYMGFCLPLAWKTTSLHAVLLYAAMGTGKAAGGILADAFGVKKTALISAAASLPFVLLGNKIMLVSLLGIMLFSMTMSVSLALIVSVMKSAPGLSFGYTTTALTLGVLPIFFFGSSSYAVNSVILSVFTIVCLAAFALIIRKDVKVNAQSQIYS